MWDWSPSGMHRLATSPVSPTWGGASGSAEMRMGRGLGLYPEDGGMPEETGTEVQVGRERRREKGGSPAQACGSC